MNSKGFEERLIRAISPNELMLLGDEGHYFQVGRSALGCIDVSLRAAGIEEIDVKRVLDLPCGHGRVTRFLRLAFPESEISACDLLRDGVDYCAKTFSAVPVYSHDDPRKIPLERDAFDLIWVGSLFTHFDSELWPTTLEVFQTFLRPGGVLIFTAHGRKTYENMLNGSSYSLLPRRKKTILYEYERHGFGFTEYPSVVPGTKKSLYGVSLSSPEWVIAQTTRVNGLRVVHYSEGAWDNHQDCIACVRDDSVRHNTQTVNFSSYLNSSIPDFKSAVREHFPALVRFRDRCRRG